MANPTTNYGFVLPTPTDLVTDLPADFEVALQGVDTQMKTNADATIAKSIVDAKGDIIAATAADTVSRLAVGANDTVLVADSSTATGLKWALPASGGMTLLSTTTLSGATTTISSISQSYTKLQVYVYGVTNATANDQFFVRPNGNYEYGIYTYMSNAALGQETGNEIYLARTGQELLRTNANNSWSIELNNYASSTAYKPFNYFGAYINTTSTKRSSAGFGAWADNTAITSIQFGNYGGNLSTGTVLIYGVK